MLKCINDFAGMTDADVVNKTLGVHTGMSGNTAFPSPPVTMDQLAAANQEFADGVVQAASRDKLKVTLKNTLRKSLISLLSKLLTYVNNEANGDKAILQSSGFTLGKETTGAADIGSFTNVKVIHGKNSGDVMVRYTRVPGAVSYEIDYAEAPVVNDVWKMVPEVTSSHLFSGLPRAKEYSFRIRAIGRRQQTAVSQVITILVL